MPTRSLTAGMLRVGLGVSGGLVLLSLIFPPLGIAGLLGVGATFLAIAVHGARQHGGGWWATWTIPVSLGLWVAGSIVAWDFWGVGFDLADAGLAVPVGITAVTFASAGVAAVAFVVMLGTGILCTAKLRGRCAHAGLAAAGSAGAAG